jgi:hypothetical protein
VTDASNLPVGGKYDLINVPAEARDVLISGQGIAVSSPAPDIKFVKFVTPIELRETGFGNRREIDCGYALGTEGVRNDSRSANIAVCKSLRHFNVGQVPAQISLHSDRFRVAGILPLRDDIEGIIIAALKANVTQGDIGTHLAIFGVRRDVGLIQTNPTSECCGQRCKRGRSYSRIIGPMALLILGAIGVFWSLWHIILIQKYILRYSIMFTISWIFFFAGTFLGITAITESAVVSVFFRRLSTVL